VPADITDRHRLNGLGCGHQFVPVEVAAGKPAERIAVTVPTASWPRMRPGVTSGTSPPTMCKSVPADGHGIDPHNRVGGFFNPGVENFFPRPHAWTAINQWAHVDSAAAAAIHPTP
jgi:hypothetical protein